MRYTLVYLAMLITFMVVDLLWLGVVAKSFYQQHIGHWLADQVNWPAAVLFYLLFLVGILLFVVQPFHSRSLITFIGYAFMFGVVTYAAYDLTNLATVKDWPVIITVVDMLWGGLLCSVVALVGRYVLLL